MKTTRNRNLKERGTNHKMQHSKICFACGKQRTRSHMVYHIPTMKAYCEESSICGNREEHPEYLARIFPNLPEYQYQLVKADDFENIIGGLEFFFTDNTIDNWILKFLGKAISTRVEPYQALALTKVAKKHGFDKENKNGEVEANIQETIRFIIEDYISRNKRELDNIKLD